MSRALASERARSLTPSLIRQMASRRRPDTLDLTLGQPSLPPDADLLEAARARLDAGGHGYTENAGLSELRGLVAAHHALPGRGGPEHVVMSVGSEQGLYAAMTATLDPGDEVLVPDPGFPAYPAIAKLVNATPVAYPVSLEGGLVPRAETIAPLITPRTRAIVLNDPSNPFGAILPADELDRLAELVERHELVAISDEIYRDLRYDGGAPDSVGNRTERAIVVGGLSKSCALTGHRIGYVIAPEALSERLVFVNQMMVACAPRPAQCVALEAFLRPGVLTKHVETYAKTRSALREAAADLPPEATLHVGGGGFYAVLDVRAFSGGDPLALALALLDEENVAVVPGTAFGARGAWFWRMSYAAGVETVQEALRRISRFLAARPTP